MSGWPSTISISVLAIEVRVAALAHRKTTVQSRQRRASSPARRRRPRWSTQSDADRRVPEHQRLVAEVLVDAVVPIEMIRRQIRQHADARIDARRIVQLERRHLERDPVRRRRRQRQLGERRADVAGRRPRDDPSAVSRWPISAVVVVLPFVPVIAM